MLRRLPDSVFRRSQWAILASGLRTRARPPSKPLASRRVPAEDADQAHQIVTGPVPSDDTLLPRPGCRREPDGDRTADHGPRSWRPASSRPSVRIPGIGRRRPPSRGPRPGSPTGATPGGATRLIRLVFDGDPWAALFAASVMVAGPPLADGASDGDRTDISSATGETLASRWPEPRVLSSTESVPTCAACSRASTRAV